MQKITRVRFWFKKSRAGSLIWRLLIGLVGGAVSVFGGIMLIAPGPGLLLILAGLGILATEFAWAGEMVLHAKRLAATAEEKSGLHRYVQYFIIAGGSVAGILIIYIMN